MKVNRNGREFSVDVRSDDGVTVMWIAPPARGDGASVPVCVGEVDGTLPANKLKKLAVKLMRQQPYRDMLDRYVAARGEMRR